MDVLLASIPLALLAAFATYRFVLSQRRAAFEAQNARQRAIMELVRSERRKP